VAWSPECTQRMKQEGRMGARHSVEQLGLRLRPPDGGLRPNRPARRWEHRDGRAISKRAGPGNAVTWAGSMRVIVKGGLVPCGPRRRLGLGDQPRSLG
jgi:hypothetical protein